MTPATRCSGLALVAGWPCGLTCRLASGGGFGYRGGWRRRHRPHVGLEMAPPLAVALGSSGPRGRTRGGWGGEGGMGSGIGVGIRVGSGWDREEGRDEGREGGSDGRWQRRRVACESTVLSPGRRWEACCPAGLRQGADHGALTDDGRPGGVEVERRCPQGSNECSDSHGVGAAHGLKRGHPGLILRIHRHRSKDDQRVDRCRDPGQGTTGGRSERPGGSDCEGAASRAVAV